MNKIGFYLKSTKSATTKISVKFTENQQRFQIQTPVTINPKDWNKSKMRCKTTSDELIKNNEQLDRIELLIKGVIIRIDYFDYDDVLKQCKQVITQSYAPQPNQQYITIQGKQIAIAKQKENKKEYVPPTPFKTLDDLFDDYYVKKEHRINPDTKKQYVSVQNSLKKTGLNKIKIDELKADDINVTYANYFIKKGYLNSSVNNKLRKIRAVIRAYDDTHPARKIELFTEDENSAYVPLLSEFEIIKNTKYTEGVERAKDLFVFCCGTGQRVSDLLKLKKSEIVPKDTMQGEIMVWRINQKKTGAKVVEIPLDDYLMNILEKYDYQLPVMTEQVYRRHLKTIIRKSGIDKPFNYGRKSGTKLITTKNIEGKQEENIMCSHMTSTHTARRTYVTHSLAKGVPSPFVALVTNQTLRTLEKYNQITFDLMIEQQQKKKQEENLVKQLQEQIEKLTK